MKREPYVFNRPCGNLRSANESCRAAFKDRRPVHVIPGLVDVFTEPLLVMPTYHYATAEEGLEAIRVATETAPTVATDDDLYRYRREGVAHYLPVGWVDPSRR